MRSFYDEQNTKYFEKNIYKRPDSPEIETIVIDQLIYDQIEAQNKANQATKNPPKKVVKSPSPTQRFSLKKPTREKTNIEQSKCSDKDDTTGRIINSVGIKDEKQPKKESHGLTQIVKNFPQKREYDISSIIQKIAQNSQKDQGRKTRHNLSPIDKLLSERSNTPVFKKEKDEKFQNFDLSKDNFYQKETCVSPKDIDAFQNDPCLIPEVEKQKNELSAVSNFKEKQIIKNQFYTDTKAVPDLRQIKNADINVYSNEQKGQVEAERNSKSNFEKGDNQQGKNSQTSQVSISSIESNFGLQSNFSLKGNFLFSHADSGKSVEQNQMLISFSGANNEVFSKSNNVLPSNFTEINSNQNEKSKNLNFIGERSKDQTKNDSKTPEVFKEGEFKINADQQSFSKHKSGAQTPKFESNLHNSSCSQETSEKIQDFLKEGIVGKSVYRFYFCLYQTDLTVCLLEHLKKENLKVAEHERIIKSLRLSFLSKLEEATTFKNDILKLYQNQPSFNGNFVKKLETHYEFLKKLVDESKWLYETNNNTASERSSHLFKIESVCQHMQSNPQFQINREIIHEIISSLEALDNLQFSFDSQSDNKEKVVTSCLSTFGISSELNELVNDTMAEKLKPVPKELELKTEKIPKDEFPESTFQKKGFPKDLNKDQFKKQKVNENETDILTRKTQRAKHTKSESPVSNHIDSLISDISQKYNLHHSKKEILAKKSQSFIENDHKIKYSVPRSNNKMKGEHRANINIFVSDPLSNISPRNSIDKKEQSVYQQWKFIKNSFRANEAIS